MGGVTSDSSVACGEGRRCGCRAMTGRVDPEAHSNLVLTVGHSTRTFKEFLSLLRAQGVRRLVDGRRFPTPRVIRTSAGRRSPSGFVARVRYATRTCLAWGTQATVSGFAERWLA